MKYLKDVFTIILIGIGLILTAFFLAAQYTINIITYPKRK
jgi:hypothetical protein